LAKYLARRAFTSAMVLVISMMLVFVSIRILPGDPVLAKYGASAGATPEALDVLRHEAGLDRPILAQMFTWLKGVVRGDLGTSYFSQLHVTQLVMERLPATLELTFLIILFACIFAIVLTPFSVHRPGSLADRVIGYFISLGLSIPSFVIGIIFILLFSLHWQILPSRGFTPLSESISQNLIDMIMPSVTGALVATPYLVKYLRTSMLEIKASSFVRTAEGKGQTTSKILFKHILPNALVPTLAMLGLIVGYTLGGVLVIEYMFGLPGIGSLAIESASTRDYALLQGVSILVISLFILTTFIFDLICALVDPRLRVKK
jgi:peptide/nickel transport system permease protein